MARAKKGIGFVWQADDFSEGEVEHHQFAIRFKTEQTANEFKSAVEEMVVSITNGNKPKTIKNKGSVIIYIILFYFY